MRIIRNFSEIGSNGNYIQKSGNALRQEKIKIQKYINEILNNYEGKDALEIVNKFIEATNKIDIISDDFEYYGNYMQQLASYDRENLERTVSSFNQLNADINIDKNNSIDILNTKINLDNSNTLNSDNFDFTNLNSEER